LRRQSEPFGAAAIFDNLPKKWESLVMSRLLSAVTLLAALLALSSSGAGRASAVHPTVPVRAASRAASDPWSAGQTVLPGVLAKEISDSGSSAKPVIVCVGYHALFHGAHIPGSSYHGPAATPEGLADLKKWAQMLPHSADVVVYCGCCPLEHCPNIRPAFEVLRDAHPARLRVLLLPTDFATDWIAKGYPVERGD
jgi:thiosulfate/3-mercaptopyruvate sulfurtransferase